MPDDSRPGGSSNGDADSRRGLWHAIRKFFDEESETSLRAQIEEAIDEHEDEQASGEEAPTKGDLSPAELIMLRNLLHFSEHDADDVAIPRGEIIAVAADARWDEMVALFAEHGHSRMPVYRETLDQVIGMMHIKDVFPFLANGISPPADWTTLMRQPLYVPQARGALDVLADMRARRMHLAIVVDEFSGTDGIITIEDLVEEIVGDIEDEHDEAPVELSCRSAKECGTPTLARSWTTWRRRSAIRASRKSRKRSTLSADSPSCWPSRYRRSAPCCTIGAAGASR